MGVMLLEFGNGKLQAGFERRGGGENALGKEAQEMMLGAERPLGCDSRPW